jgi:hypothetical protein
MQIPLPFDFDACALSVAATKRKHIATHHENRDGLALPENT